jgi:hypothetical protein
MMRIRHGKIILGLALVFLLAMVSLVSGQTTKTFSGKITEIAKGRQLDIGKTDIFFTLKLDEYPKIQFRLTPEDAVKFGVIETAGVTGVVTPKMSKGMGWKVKLTCDAKNVGDFKAPVYKVTSLVRQED